MFVDLMAGKLGREIYKDRRWRILRRAVLDKNGWRCEKCGRAGPLEVHHKKPIKTHAHLAFELKNLMAVCRPCHFTTHSQPPRWKILLSEFVNEVRS